MKIKYLLIIALFFGCSPSAYKTISKEEPKDLQEKNWLAARCKAEFPVDTTSKPIIFDSVPDSSAYFKRKADSLALVKGKVVTRLELQYKDTCTSAPLLYASGFNEGFDLGYVEGKTDSEIKIKRLITDKEKECNTAHEAAMTKLKQENAYAAAECETSKKLIQEDNDKKANRITALEKKVKKKNTELWIHRSLWLILLIIAGFWAYKQVTTFRIKRI